MRSQRKIEVGLAPYSAAVLETIPLSELFLRPGEEFLYLEFQGEEGERPIRFFNEFFPVRYKEYQLPSPRIRKRIFKDENGVFHLELSTDKPAFFVFAEFRGIRAVFSDNSFTLLPDRPRDLTFRTDGELSAAELEKALIVRDLRGSYEE